MNQNDGSPRSVFMKLLEYCSTNDWAGYDPYDALNSRLFESSPLAESKNARLVATQLLKRAPINLRHLLQIPKTQNPKAIALFLMALLNVPELGGESGESEVSRMAERLAELRSPDTPHWCWGYSFPWQTRFILVPRWAPNLVCTTFAAEACLSFYERCAVPKYLEMAVSAAEYILSNLYWDSSGSIAGFSYPLPTVRNQVHNANFLAAALFCHVFKHTKDVRFLEPALKAARYSAGKQHPNGSWPYGEDTSQQWIDSFHTGYNLCALRSISRDLGTDEFDSCIRLGLNFYTSNFFREDGEAKYFHNRRYPVDIHCVAQGIITFLECSELQPDGIRLAHSLFKWAMRNMRDNRGFFYYRVYRLGTVRTSYMRWSQAWMLLALSKLVRNAGVFDQGHDPEENSETCSHFRLMS